MCLSILLTPKKVQQKILKQTHNFYSSENVSTRELLIHSRGIFFSFQLYTELVFLGNLKINNHKKNYYKTCKYVIERY